MAPTSTTAARDATDLELIRRWQRTPTGARKDALLRALLEKKRGLIRRLTEKAAFAEKTDAAEEDLLQAGTIGFLRAVEDFDCDRGLSIATYAAWWVKHEVQRMARSSRVVTLPRIRLTNAERNRVLVALHENRDVTANELGLPETKVEQVRASYGVQFVPAEVTARGDSLFERRTMRVAEDLGPEEALDARRQLAVLEHVIARVRAGEGPDELGVEVYEAAIAVIAEREEDARMAEQQQENELGPALAKGRTHEERAESARRAWEKRRRAAAKKKPAKRTARRAPQRPTARDRVARRLAELDAERALLEQLRDAPDEVLARVRALLG